MAVAAPQAVRAAPHGGACGHAVGAPELPPGFSTSGLPRPGAVLALQGRVHGPVT